MTLVDVALQEQHREKLIALLDKPNGVEGAAYGCSDQRRSTLTLGKERDGNG